MSITKTSIIIAAAVVAVTVFIPAIKGPINRYRLQANEALAAEYMVDNYKAEYVKLHEKRAALLESVSKFSVEKTFAKKKLEYAEKQAKAAKANLRSIGISDLAAFAKAKNAYETIMVERSNYIALTNTYENALAKLNKTLALIDGNMQKAKLNVDTLSAKKTLLDTIKTVNKSIETMNGVGDSDLAVNIEKLDNDMLRESIKLEALDTDASKATALTEAEAKAYIENLK